MKNIILLFLLCLGFASCEERVTISQEEYKLLKNGTDNSIVLPDFQAGRYEISGVRIIEVDSCQVITGSSGGPIAFHRPRCKYCIERALKQK